MNPELDEHGIPQEARPPRKWLAYLLTGICLASGIAQMYWAVSIASTQMVGDYHRWTDINWVPVLPGYVALLAGIGAVFASIDAVGLSQKKGKYSKTERRVLYTAGVFAVAAGGIGLYIMSHIEPSSFTGGGLGCRAVSPADIAEPFPCEEYRTIICQGRHQGDRAKPRLHRRKSRTDARRWAEGEGGDHPSPSGQRWMSPGTCQERFASLRDGLRPHLTEPVRRPPGSL
jgi:hypothetical protein